MCPSYTEAQLLSKRIRQLGIGLKNVPNNEENSPIGEFSLLFNRLSHAQDA
jgi:hypothetical protein